MHAHYKSRAALEVGEGQKEENRREEDAGKATMENEGRTVCISQSGQAYSVPLHHV